MTEPRGVRLRPWILGFAVWTGLALLSAAQIALVLRHAGRTFSGFELVLERLADWYTCALFTPLFFWLVRRFPLDPGRRARHLAVHLLAVVAAVLLKYPMYAAAVGALRVGPYEESLESLLVRGFIAETMGFAAILAVIYGIEMQREVRRREVQSAQMQGQLAQARLEVLTASLQPHFLFNTLHGISTLMRRDVAAADEMITGLGDLLRRSLAGGGSVEIPVAEEMELVRSYLSIMQIRFGDRLTTDVRLDPPAADAQVPRLLLQPLVENAIRHGIARRPGSGRVEVRASAHGDRLRLVVADDGEGAALDGETFVREGTGLSNTRSRLAAMFGDRATLRVANRPGGGLEVQVDVPLRRAPAGGPR